MQKSNVDRRAEMLARRDSAQAALSSRFGQKFKVVLRVGIGSIDKFVVERHTKSNGQESVAVIETT